MTAEARRTLDTIRDCLATDRFSLTVHFSERMAQRGLFWPDVEAVIDEPDEVRSEGMDDYNRPRWAISGETATSGEIEIICAVETDETDTEFITLYWED